MATGQRVRDVQRLGTNSLREIDAGTSQVGLGFSRCGNDFLIAELQPIFLPQQKRRLHSIVNVKFVKNIAQVGAHRVFSDNQAFSNLAVGEEPIF